MIRFTRYFIPLNSLLPRRMFSPKALMVLAWVGLGGMSLGACQSSTVQPSASPSEGQEEPVSRLEQGSEAQNTQPTHQDLLRSIPSWDAHTTPGLPYTSPADRLSQVKVGRPDPFAPTETIVVNVDPQLTAQQAPETSVAKTSAAQNTDASTSLVPLQLPPLPVTVSSDSLPPVNVPVQDLPPVSIPATVATSPTHLADQMQLKGIVELNQQWQAIVWEPQSSVSKTVRAGDVIGNGQVKVRRIEQTSNGLLRLVLEQNGIEVIHTVS